MVNYKCLRQTLETTEAGTPFPHADRQFAGFCKYALNTRCIRPAQKEKAFTMSKTEHLCITEVRDLHQFFQDWFAGAIAQSEENFTRVTHALNERFVLISPGGALAEYATVIEWLRSGYGTRPGFRLWTERITLRHQEGDVALVTYEEWQETDAGVTTRLSSALFRRRDQAPNGVEWLHVHETWLPQPC
jgi:hypothetical protein